MSYRIYVSVNISAGIESEEEFMPLWRIVNHRVDTIAAKFGGIHSTGAGTGFGCRDFDYECDDRRLAEAFLARLGTRMVVRRGPQEIGLPVRSDVVEIELFDLYEARQIPGETRVSWEHLDVVEAWQDIDPTDSMAVLKVSAKASQAEIIACLRDLALELEATAARQP